MSGKRARPTEATSASRPAKRPKVDPELAKIWERLADDDKEVRIQATLDLLKNHCEDNNVDIAKIIARRLIKGLCSSRKGARPGFYIAFAAALNGLARNGKLFGCDEITLGDTISMIEAETVPERETSGEDERAHYFGRLLGCVALVTSEATLGGKEDLTKTWTRVLTIITSLMAQKPWLRSEASSTICQFISQIAKGKTCNTENRTSIVSETFKQLHANRLLRTIDGIYIWIHVQETLPKTKSKLPANTWKGDDPLTLENLPRVKQALLDSRGADEEDEALGTSIWTPKLHNAWRLVLRRIGRKDDPKKKTLFFALFWKDVVDEGLFNPTATPERKYTGFLVLECALTEVIVQHVPACFSKNLMVCMTQSLRSSSEAYLTRIVVRCFANVKEWVTHKNTPDPPKNTEDEDDEVDPVDLMYVQTQPQDKTDTDRVSAIIQGLLVGSDYADFDTTTKSDILSSFFEISALQAGSGIWSQLLVWLVDTPGSKDDLPIAKIQLRRKNILNILGRALCQRIRQAPSESGLGPLTWDKLGSIIREVIATRKDIKVDTNVTVPYDEATQSLFTEKISQILEAMLSAGPVGQFEFFSVIRTIKDDKLEAEDSIKQAVDECWSILNRLNPDIEYSWVLDYVSCPPDARKPTQWKPENGMGFLLAVLLHDIYSGEADSIEMLDDVKSMAGDLSQKSRPKETTQKVADHAVDICLSFASRASKLHRRVAGLAFETLAPRMSSEGLKALTDVLATKEGREGQQQLFENGEDEDIEMASDEEAGSDDDDLDSDVEVIDGEADSDVDIASATPSSSSGNSDSENEDDEEDPNLTSFESALAAALGTRKLTENDAITRTDSASSTPSSSANSSMSDSRMLALDAKLAEVFRNQANAASAQRLRASQRRNAKENVVNLKNRAMDLVEVFLRAEQKRGLECVELLCACLGMAVGTGTPQLANRGVEIVKGYVSRTKDGKGGKGGKGERGPKPPESKGGEEGLVGCLRSVHGVVVAGKEVSNALIDVAGQLNILICKLLVANGTRDISAVVEKVAGEVGSKDDVRRKAVQDFWSRYEAWLGSSQQKESNGTNAGQSVGDTTGKSNAVTSEGKKEQKAAKQGRSKRKKEKKPSTAE